MKEIYNYQLRAECYLDVIEFIHLWTKEHSQEIWKIVITPDQYGYPDVDFEFSTFGSMIEVLKVMKKLPDSHVMMDTLAYKENYNGKRRYVDWDNIELTEEFLEKFRSAL